MESPTHYGVDDCFLQQQSCRRGHEGYNKKMDSCPCYNVLGILSLSESHSHKRDLGIVRLARTCSSASALSLAYQSQGLPQSVLPERMSVRAGAEGVAGRNWAKLHSQVGLDLCSAECLQRHEAEKGCTGARDSKRFRKDGN